MRAPRPLCDASESDVRAVVAFAPFSPLPANKKDAPDPKALTTLPLQKIVYLLCNLLTLGLGLWKCRSMGLLPMGTGDWLAFESRGPVRVGFTRGRLFTDGLCLAAT